MDEMTVVQILSRWAHVGTAIVLLGGSIFMRYVLMPSAKETLSDDQHAVLRDRVRGRWKKFVHLGIGLLLLSGFYNYYVGMQKEDLSKLYHPLIGTKILLAFGVFFIAEALVGKSAAFEKMRANPGKWMSLLILLAALVTALAGVVKVMGGATAGS